MEPAFAVRRELALGIAWLSRLIRRRVPVTSFQNAFDGRPEDVKVVLDFGAV